MDKFLELFIFGIIVLGLTLYKWITKTNSSLLEKRKSEINKNPPPTKNSPYQSYSKLLDSIDIVDKNIKIDFCIGCGRGFDSCRCK